MDAHASQGFAVWRVEVHDHVWFAFFRSLAQTLGKTPVMVSLDANTQLLSLSVRPGAACQGLARCRAALLAAQLGDAEGPTTSPDLP